MDSFLHQTAQSIIDSMEWRDLSRTTLVLPSHRAGLVLRDEILRIQQERQAQAIWAPHVRTLTQLQDELSELYPEDELMTIARLYRIYNGDLPLDIFYGWGRQMIADFTNIDASMDRAEVPSFFDNTIAAHALERWQIDPETEERLRGLVHPHPDKKPSVSSDGERTIRARYEDLWERLFELYSALHEELESVHKGYPGMRQRAVIEHWDEPEIQEKIAGRRYIFVGFNYLLPVELELMKRLRDAGQAQFYWDYTADFDTNTKAFSFAQRNAAVLGAANSPQRLSEPIECTVVECVSREAQAQFVHQWLLENYRHTGDRVGVVICDETMLEPVIYALPAVTAEGETEPAPINITKGFPLRNTRIYADALRWLADPARGKSEDLVSPEFIDTMIAALFPASEEPIEEEAREITPEEEHGFNWQELLILESEYQVRKTLNQMRALVMQGLGNAPFTLKLLRLLLRRMMEGVSMPFHGEPVTDIQVMGVLETRLLDFDRLLILNVEEGVIPQRQTDISFIPYYLRKTYHMQTPDERASVYAYNFFRLLSRAGHTTMLYATAETAEGGRGMSRFIMQMMASSQFRITHKTLLERSNINRSALLPEEDVLASLLSQLRVDEHGVVRRLSGERFMLSPSAINTYLTCPRSFYLQYILGLRPEEPEEALFGPATIGSFVHHAMEHLYQPMIGKPLSSGAIEDMAADDERMNEALLAAYEEMNKLWLTDHPDEPNHYIFEHHSGENVIIIGYIRNILARDSRDAQSGLAIHALEDSYRFSLALDGIGEILMGGTVDRLDLFGDAGEETMRVIDYKSGGYNDQTHAKKMSSNWEELMTDPDKGYVRQTLIYCNAVMHQKRPGYPIEPHLYFCRHNVASIDTSIVVDSKPVTDFKSIQKEFVSHLQEAVTQILTTDRFPLCTPDKCPSYCPFFRICGRKPIEL